MAPKKKLSHSSESTTTTATNKRFTRSSALLSDSGIKTRSSTKSPAKPPAKSPAKKKAKTKTAAKSPPAAPRLPSPPLPDEKKTIIIEYCLEDETFLFRASDLETELEKYAGQINVVINPEEPRKGCFEVRGEDGKIYVTLLDLKPPYQELIDVDMSKLVSDIAAPVLSED